MSNNHDRKFLTLDHANKQAGRGVRNPNLRLKAQQLGLLAGPEALCPECRRLPTRRLHCERCATR